MIAIDTNILVYAHREDSTFHPAADRVLTEIAESGREWAIPYSCLHEFYAIVTHPQIYNPPTPIKDALKQIDYWLECPTLRLIGEMTDYWTVLKAMVQKGKIYGAHIHDARIAAVCVQNNIKTLWSADRDFRRIVDLAVKNPLI